MARRQEKRNQAGATTRWKLTKDDTRKVFKYDKAQNKKLKLFFSDGFLINCEAKGFRRLSVSR
ncbi:MAG: hypothetical protein A2939_05120 [Parcubacteria group bacterium RIFCSPLOWO2_01_FULL_48_18]|nr:MAG: hypothetical protein A3J67_03405 [Parcubacteria group bacterium RIFCSPHIGHO2_02_FULL_48_10b]OHB22249.1 MAG: hypothetical protein A2939_05120 [Parcubacteria group bacterium RIFCSPLOWO2_01_FULL_48_18]